MNARTTEITSDPTTTWWSYRSSATGRFVSRAQVHAEMARIARAYTAARVGLAPWPSRMAGANVADVASDARAFFGVANPLPRPLRAARRRAAESARSWGFTAA